MVNFLKPFEQIPLRVVAFILILFLFPSAKVRHPFYVSMTEIEWKPSEKKLELAIRMFTDDLEKALAKDCNCKTDLSVNDKEAAMNQILKDYIQKNCRIFSGRQKAALHFIGREREE